MRGSGNRGQAHPLWGSQQCSKLKQGEATIQGNTGSKAGLEVRGRADFEVVVRGQSGDFQKTPVKIGWEFQEKLEDPYLREGEGNF